MTETYFTTETEIRSIQPIPRGQWIAVFAEDGKAIRWDVAAWGEVWERRAEWAKGYRDAIRRGEWSLGGFHALVVDGDVGDLDRATAMSNFLGVWPANTNLRSDPDVIAALAEHSKESER